MCSRCDSHKTLTEYEPHAKAVVGQMADSGAKQTGTWRKNSDSLAEAMKREHANKVQVRMSRELLHFKAGQCAKAGKMH